MKPLFQMDYKNRHSHLLLENSQNLRKNMTPEEKKLWYQFFKRLPLTVKRQEIFNGYILDFYISKFKLAIELDGIQHNFSENKSADEKRDAELLSCGIKVLRYSNVEINQNFIAVCRDILKHVGLCDDDLKPL